MSRRLPHVLAPSTGGSDMSTITETARPRMTVADYNAALRRIEARVSAALKAGEPKRKVSDLRQELEFQLTIDYRLGEDFPKDRRDALVTAHRALQKSLKAAIGRHV